MSSATSGHNLQLLRVNHNAKMVEAFEMMLSDESLCDVSLVCDGRTVKAHRVILAACSAYFKQILSSISAATAHYPVIIVTGVSVDDLRAILEFMYRGEVTIPKEQLPSLVRSAETLQVSGLSQLDPNSDGSTLADSSATVAAESRAEQDKNRTSSPSDSLASSGKRGRKRKKLMNKEEKEKEEKKSMKENQVVEESWRNSRLRRPPLKYSEYSMSKSADIKKADKCEADEKPVDAVEVVDDELATAASLVEVKPPLSPIARPQSPRLPRPTSPRLPRPTSPRLTRGRSRVYSQDEHKESPTKSETITIETSVSSAPSTSHENLTIHLTPNTRSRKLTHSPSESKTTAGDLNVESAQQESDKFSAKAMVEEDSHSPTRSKTQLKTQSTNFEASFSVSKIKWCPKNAELAAKKILADMKAPESVGSTEIKYNYESIEEDGPPVYRCTYCARSFRSKQNIVDHIRSVHIGSNERYVCPLCNKQFKWRTSLNNHLNQSHPLSRPTPMRHFDKNKKTKSRHSIE